MTQAGLQLGPFEETALHERLIFLMAILRMGLSRECPPIFLLQSFSLTFLMMQTKYALIRSTMLNVMGLQTAIITNIVH